MTSMSTHVHETLPDMPNGTKSDTHHAAAKRTDLISADYPEIPCHYNSDRSAPVGGSPIGVEAAMSSAVTELPALGAPVDRSP